MKVFELGQDYQWAASTTKYPTYIGIYVDFLLSTIKCHRPVSTLATLPVTATTTWAMKNYRSYFAPGSIQFTFPKEYQDQNKAPSKWYHAMEGESIMLVDWKLAYPSNPLYCFNCKHNQAQPNLVHLEHMRTNYSKNRTLFPLWTESGRPTWCIVMQYKCPVCKSKFKANDSRILCDLPAHVAEAYPVVPSKANGTFHFNTALTDDLEKLMLTYANAPFVSKKLYRKMNLQYTRKVETYFSKNPSVPFLFVQSFLGGSPPPPLVTQSSNTLWQVSRVL